MILDLLVCFVAIVLSVIIFNKPIRQKLKFKGKKAISKVSNSITTEAENRRIKIEEYEDVVDLLENEIVDMLAAVKNIEDNLLDLEEDRVKCDNLVRDAVANNDRQNATYFEKQLVKVEEKKRTLESDRDNLNEKYQYLKSKLDDKKEEIETAKSKTEVFEARLAGIEVDEKAQELEETFGKLGDLNFGDDVLEKRENQLEAKQKVSTSNLDHALKSYEDNRASSAVEERISARFEEATTSSYSGGSSDSYSSSDD